MSIWFYEMNRRWSVYEYFSIIHFSISNERACVCICVCVCARACVCVCMHVRTYSTIRKSLGCYAFPFLPMFRSCRQSREKKARLKTIYRLVISSNVITDDDLVTFRCWFFFLFKGKWTFLLFLYYYFFFYYYYRCFLLLLLLVVSRKAWRLGGSLHIHRFATISLEGWCSGVL